MNRRIKFRAWDKQSKILVSEYYFSQLFDGKTIAAFPDVDLRRHHDPTELIKGVQYKGNPFKMPNLILMQYTGLKDKKGTGVETYEGDLVQRRDGKQGEVIWHQESCGFAIAFNDDEPLGSLSSWFEVVGNVWES